MIKLLGLLLPLVLLFADEKSFLLPDEQSRFVHFLAKEIKSASDNVLILTPSLNHSELKKALIRGAQKGAAVTLVVQDLKTAPLTLVQYARIDLFVYRARVLQGTTLIIDDRLICTLPLPLEEEEFADQASLVRCSDAPEAISSARSSLGALLKRSVPYLK